MSYQYIPFEWFITLFGYIFWVLSLSRSSSILFSVLSPLVQTLANNLSTFSYSSAIYSPPSAGSVFLFSFLYLSVKFTYVFLIIFLSLLWWSVLSFQFQFTPEYPVISHRFRHFSLSLSHLAVDRFVNSNSCVSFIHLFSLSSPPSTSPRPRRNLGVLD